jgi:hypothetical protein
MKKTIKQLANNTDSSIVKLDKVNTDLTLPLSKNNNNKITTLDTIEGTDNPEYITFDAQDVFFGVGTEATQMVNPEGDPPTWWIEGEYVMVTTPRGYYLRGEYYGTIIRYDWIQALYFESNEEITFEINGYEKTITPEPCYTEEGELTGIYFYNFTPEDLAIINPAYNMQVIIKIKITRFGRHSDWIDTPNISTYPFFAIPPDQTFSYYKPSGNFKKTYSSGELTNNNFSFSTPDNPINFLYTYTLALPYIDLYYADYDTYMDKWTLALDSSRTTDSGVVITFSYTPPTPFVPLTYNIQIISSSDGMLINLTSNWGFIITLGVYGSAEVPYGGGSISKFFNPVLISYTVNFP